MNGPPLRYSISLAWTSIVLNFLKVCSGFDIRTNKFANETYLYTLHITFYCLEEFRTFLQKVKLDDILPNRPISNNLTFLCRGYP